MARRAPSNVAFPRFGIKLPGMQRLVVAITGASGSIYAQSLLDHLQGCGHEVHVILSVRAHEVAAHEIDGLRIPQGFHVHDENSMNAPFVSGSSLFARMAICPCSMGTLGRIAHGYSDNAITRAADVFLKERRALILVPRETPWNLIQARNVVALIEAGATVLPAIPSFYHRPATAQEVAETVVARVLDHLGVENRLARRWKESPETEADDGE
jgi:4-hydroxy-3-polyprenylbenzoate decarboxylase